MATINLGAIKFNWKGAYNSSTSYAVDDVVSSGGNSYVCIQAHSNQAVGNATAYWNIMSSAGTNGSNGSNGTDLTSTLTTQGDILYRDGSGLQRLAKGTASQTLKMNSGANAPEWATVATPTSPFGTALLHVQHETADGTNGGSTSNNAWRERTLNHIQTNEISGASLSANVITLPAGNYFLMGNSFYTNSVYCSTRIINKSTSNSLVLMGTNLYTEGYASGTSYINGRFTLSGSHNLELQYYCTSSYSNTGFGFHQPSTGNVNKFADIMIWKL
jgi:hypothetical protein